MNLGKVGIIIGGGGFTGAFSVGDLKAIWEFGIKPKYIQGVSVGALNAAKIIESDDPEKLVQLWLAIEKNGASSIFNWWDATKNIVARKPGLFTNKGVSAIINSFNLQKIIDSPIELQIACRNESKNWRMEIINSHEKRFRENPELLGKFLFAATALQGGLDPVEINGEKYSDAIGFSLEAMVETGCDTIFLLLNEQADKDQDRWDQRLSKARHILYDENVEFRLEKFLREHKDFDVIFEDEDDENENIPMIIKKMMSAVKSARSVITSAARGNEINFAPHRIFPINTRTPISTLYTYGYMRGDIKAATEQGYDQTSTLLNKILK